MPARSEGADEFNVFVYGSQIGTRQQFASVKKTAGIWIVEPKLNETADIGLVRSILKNSKQNTVSRQIR